MYTSKFLYRLAEQLRSEIRAGCKGFLLDYLRGHRFWLRAEAILFIKETYPNLLQDYYFRMDENSSGKLFFVESYFKDVYIWLPHIIFNMVVPCPKCPVKETQFCEIRRDGATRRIRGLRADYFIISCRYKCKRCSNKFASTNQDSIMKLDN